MNKETKRKLNSYAMKKVVSDCLDRKIMSVRVYVCVVIKSILKIEPMQNEYIMCVNHMTLVSIRHVRYLLICNCTWEKRG